MYRIIKKFLFLFEAEKAHTISFNAMKMLFKIPFITQIVQNNYALKNKNIQLQIMGLLFNNPIGLAAGFDKNGVNIDELANYVFVFIEVGTVTPKPQEGNQKPRLFRLIKDEAIINRMGFNNDGVDALIENLKKVKNKQIIIGGILVKIKIHPMKMLSMTTRYVLRNYMIMYIIL